MVGCTTTGGISGAWNKFVGMASEAMVSGTVSMIDAGDWSEERTSDGRKIGRKELHWGRLNNALRPRKFPL